MRWEMCDSLVVTRGGCGSCFVMVVLARRRACVALANAATAHPLAFQWVYLSPHTTAHSRGTEPRLAKDAGVVFF